MTEAGWTVLSIALAASIAGWWLGWQEFVLLGFVGCTALLLAASFVIGLQTLDVQRKVDIDHVSVDEQLEATVVVAGRQRLGTNLTERISITTDAGIRQERQALDSAAALVRYSVPTSQRGIVDLGPVEVSKGDPLGLLKRSVSQGGTNRVWVQPRTVAVNPVPIGFSKDLEGPTFDTSPAGDVAFHALRSYTPGDDHRHIHWMSSARTGSLMVRHYVDNRQPNLAVVIDDGPHDGFELAVSIAASVVLSGLLGSGQVSLACGDDSLLASNNQRSTRDVLEALTVVAPVAEVNPSLGSLVGRRILTEPDASVIVMITGERSASEILEMVARSDGRYVIVVRCLPLTRLASAPGASVIDCHDLESFARSWNGALS